ncbi:hypothetical protein CYLTODRAFT_390084 [Cylindrobasidium torrendii FP15055 ss-10]|uniref:Eisosome component PIL1-domain-containing protein n=1 Tax=Cylindrobasidium torrendii FP15055 ss-10 TaxID=1314674 RepID=A0A0D7BMD9_9AGAR|nr:hypothetical protein CYLTODRAFT_390084 [Cylindrobasidium torrendii FP15055 ss-10]
MFKSAATRLAHNSTLPVLGGNSDLRPLQDLINSEKAVLTSLQRLSTDVAKSSEMLRTWGLGEGDDLGDVLSACTTILTYFSNAVAQYGTHEHAMRDHMKSIRAKEEALDELKRRRRGVVSKADTAERKLSKMSPEHKNLAIQTDTLNRLRDEIRAMDSDIMADEASLSDFKRTATRAMLGLKFGGLHELGQKAAIVGDHGRRLIGEIPDDTSLPGMPRRIYDGFNRVESIVSETFQGVNNVGFSSDAAGGPQVSIPPRVSGGSGHDSFLSTPRELGGTGHFMDPSDVSGPSPVSSNYTPAFPQPPPTFPHAQHRAASSVDDFGVTRRPETDNNAGKFATFPAKPPGSHGGYSLHDGPPLIGHSDPEPSFAMDVETALRKSISSERQREPAPAYEPISESQPPAALDTQAPHDYRRITTNDDDDDVGLAYDREAPASTSGGAGHTRMPSDQMVRFGSVRDIDTEIQKRWSDEKHTKQEPQDDTQRAISPSRLPATSPEEEQRELNAAAAREVSRELDALSFSPPPSRLPRETSPPRSATPPQPTYDPYARTSPPPSSFLQHGPPSPMSSRGPPSPLAPPSAPFRNMVPAHETDNDLPSPHARVGSFSLHDGHNPSNPASPESRPLPMPNSPLGGGSPLSERPQPPSLSFSDQPSSPGGPYGAPRVPFGGIRSNSSTSLNTQAGPGSPRTISAAAFRRPSPRAGSNGMDYGAAPLAAPPVADTSPLSFKKRSSIGPRDTLGSSPPRAEREPVTELSRTDEEPIAKGLPEDDYDYLSAYTSGGGGSVYGTPSQGTPTQPQGYDTTVGSPPAGSPRREDYGQLGQMKVMNRASSGYEHGKFSTNLEEPQNGGFR